MLNYVKFRRGTKQEYESLTQKSSDTLYFIINPGEKNGSLYLGTQLISGENSISENLFNLSDLKDTNLQNLQDNEVLTYDASKNQWINKPAQGSSPNISVIENLDLTPHITLIETQTADKSIKKSDIIIIKDLIIDNKYEYTAYIYNGSVWQAMDGNYNANNVYFDKDFIFTTDVGTVVIGDAGNKTVPAAGKNVTQFIEDLFSSSKDPAIIEPEASILLKEAGSYEVGTSITPNYVASFNKGSYSYGPSTDVTVTSWEINDTNNQTSSSPIGSLAKFVVNDDTNYQVSVIANHTEGKNPVNNLNIPKPDLKIQSGFKVGVSKTITGYRSFFYGLDNTNKIIDSAFVRKLKNGKNSAGNHTIYFSASELVGVKRFIIAVPTDSGLKVSKATITTSMNADATKDYHKQETTVQVEGINGATAVSYDIWIYSPASISDVEKHTVTLSK